MNKTNSRPEVKYSYNVTERLEDGTYKSFEWIVDHVSKGFKYTYKCRLITNDHYNGSAGIYSKIKKGENVYERMLSDGSIIKKMKVGQDIFWIVIYKRINGEMNCYYSSDFKKTNR